MTESGPSRTQRWWRSEPVVAVAFWLFGAVVLPLLAVDRKAHVGGSNVDDYLYTLASFQLGSVSDPVAFLSAAAGAGNQAPLMPVLTALLSPDRTSVYGFVPAQLAMLTLLYWCSRGIAMRLGSRQASLVALGVTVLPPVVAWAPMFNFSVAATATLVASTCFYSFSERLSRPAFSALFGASAGCLLISRSMALVYGAALLVGVAAHFLGRRPRPIPLRGVAAAAVPLLLVAAPYWLTSGQGVLDYLFAAGFDESVGFAPDLDLGGRVLSRATSTFNEWTPAAVLLLVALGVLFLRRHPLPDMEPDPLLRRCLVVTAGVTVALLTMSTNTGTAFSLPALPPLILAGAGVMTGGPRLEGLQRLWVLSLTVLAFLMVVPLPSAVPYLSPPWLTMLRDAGWETGSPNPEHVARDIATNVTGRPVLFLRDDALLNVTGVSLALLQTTGEQPENFSQGLNLPGWLPTQDDLAGGAAIVISGRTDGSYHFALDFAAVDARLAELGYGARCTWTLSPTNSVTLWAAGTPLRCESRADASTVTSSHGTHFEVARAAG